MKKFSIEVVGAEGLITPKDGNGSCSPYVVIDFNDEKRKTNHVNCNQNPVWNKTLSFDVVDMNKIYSKVMKLIVYHDPRNNKSNKQSRKPTSIGQVKLKLKNFVTKGKATLVHYPLKNGLLKTDSGKIGLKLYYEDEVDYGNEPRVKSDSDCEVSSSSSSNSLPSDCEAPSSPEPEPAYPEPQQQRACVNSMVYPISQQLRLCGNPVALWIEATRWWRNPTATIFVHVLLVIYAWFPDLIVPVIGFYVLFTDVRSNRSRVRGFVQAVTRSQDLRAIGILVSSCFVAVFVLCLVPFKIVTMVGGFYYLRHPILRKHNYSEHQQLYPCVDPVMQWIEDTRVWRNPNASIFVHVLLVMNVWYSSFIVPVLGLYVFIGTNINGFDLRERVQAVVKSCQNPRVIGIIVFLSLVAVLISYLVSFKVVVMLWGFYYLRHPIVRYQLHQLLRRFG